MPGRYALIVANGTYEDEKLSRLRTPTRDAEELARVLNDPEIGDFAVELALDEPEALLRRKIATFFADRGRDDLLLLHFSCHGLKDDSGQLYFAATDTEVAHLDATALSAEFVSRQMTRSRSRKVVALLDCCYSGAIARGLRFRGGDQVDLDDHLGGHGRVILTASSAMEYAFEGDELTGDGNPSVFTTAVVKGLETGEADRDQDHRISVEELYDYVCEQVREITPDQTPNMLSHLEGELYVARSAYVAPVPAADLPPELQSAIDSSLAGVREGAVRELRRLLGAHDAGVAEAARRQLQRLAEDDSRRVAAAAARVLAGGAETALPMPAPAEPAPAHLLAATVPVPAQSPAAAEPFTPPDSLVAAAARESALAARIEAERASGGSGRRVARWAPPALSVLGALVVVLALAVFHADASDGPLRRAEVVCGVAVVVAAVISALRVGWPALGALEPVLAGFPIGLAAAAGGLREQIGFYFSPRALAVGGALLMASVLWRRRGSGPRPGWALVAVVVVGSILVFISPGVPWWGGTQGTDLLQWPFTVTLLGAAVVTVVGVAVARRRGGDAWTALAAAAGGTALFTALSVGDYIDQSETGNLGPVLALVGGLVLAAAGVYAQLRS